MSRQPKIAMRSAELSLMQARAAIPKLKRRLSELQILDLAGIDNENAIQLLDSLSKKYNATLRDVYGSETIEYVEYKIDTFQPLFYIYTDEMDTSISGNMDQVKGSVGKAVATLSAAIEILNEQVGGDEEDAGSRAMRAYDGLALHPEIARVASKLYRDGHFSNAIEASVKALNGLVRYRSDLEFDGTTLMERAFNPSNPVLKFNALQDQSDKDEQKGFMQMFSGAVSGLRNPRAHGFIKDDPERSLEFIAFVSLLAKLLEGAEK